MSRSACSRDGGGFRSPSPPRPARWVGRSFVSLCLARRMGPWPTFPAAFPLVWPGATGLAHDPFVQGDMGALLVLGGQGSQGDVDLYRPWFVLIGRCLEWRLLPRLVSEAAQRQQGRYDCCTRCVGEFARDGLTIVSALDLLSERFVVSSKTIVLTRRRPSAAEARDVEFGWEIARVMGGLDVGQSAGWSRNAARAGGGGHRGNRSRHPPCRRTVPGGRILGRQGRQAAAGPSLRRAHRGLYDHRDDGKDAQG